jgi:hypothetical protein
MALSDQSDMSAFWSLSGEKQTSARPAKIDANDQVRDDGQNLYELTARDRGPLDAPDPAAGHFHPSSAQFKRAPN